MDADDIDPTKTLYVSKSPSSYTQFNQPASLETSIETRQLQSLVSMLEDVESEVVNVNDDDEVEQIKSTIRTVANELSSEMLSSSDDSDDNDDYSLPLSEDFNFEVVDGHNQLVRIDNHVVQSGSLQADSKSSSSDS